MPNGDLLSGGEGTIKINVKNFYEYWMSSQKKNIHLPVVKKYMSRISNDHKIDAPLVSGVDFFEEAWCIRSADGRHRLAAAYATGIVAVYVRMTESIETLISELCPGVLSLCAELVETLDAVDSVNTTNDVNIQFECR